MARFIALYLPQYHPTPENDEWWGKGFTEWVNVAKARPLFHGHKQPHIPADLGFYDLRLAEVREQQAELAKEAGIEAFCYWHYWFGNGRRLLERPFNEVVSSGKPDFPFCLGWANHSWYKKLWDPKSKGKDKLLIEQTYPGIEDYVLHFNTLLPAFKDHRYLKVNGKLFFLIYDPLHFEDIKTFISTWRRLAKENGLNDFYFIAQDFDSRAKKQILSLGVDAIYNSDTFNIHHKLNKFSKVMYLLQRKVLRRPTAFNYKDAIKYMVIDDCKNREVIPCISPNWDHSPRSSHNAVILKNSTPDLFKRIAKRAIEVVKGKPEDEQIVMIKSWNEWGEGNYMEPDLEFGHGYINALKEAIEEG
ncbi:Glycosyltransferase WbsX [Xylanibacter ruminicola]|uniref:Glycosyltransferase WbsX n=1 Tax=Xylanibacter ruminicola TaxID=839 RepID=A0A1M7LHE9_XYLRU|nr:glycoside hydrolase family 99-like domain-containing protein [Xylanibacter ruminicola]SFC30371.1 Glycosyltransferase WbsX [Xylanibacter ruminicola]SHM77436.1 Glycosyltransferase WbsX [Xylanibacter ruminicola]